MHDHKHKTRPVLVFNQDGREFYTYNGMLIYQAPLRVADHDIKAAEEALKCFLTWAHDKGYRPMREAK